MPCSGRAALGLLLVIAVVAPLSYSGVRILRKENARRMTDGV
jgi:hypothetical protein